MYSGALNRLKVVSKRSFYLNILNLIINNLRRNFKKNEI